MDISILACSITVHDKCLVLWN